MKKTIVILLNLKNGSHILSNTYGLLIEIPLMSNNINKKDIRVLYLFLSQINFNPKQKC